MLSVILATHNGAKTLPIALESFSRLEAPQGEWKLIVVDNGSMDDTRNILDGFMECLPLQIVDEPIPGKNRALNSALTHIDGDLVILTDDDIVAAPDWLVRMRRAADDQPGFDVFGGAIRPAWLSEPPAWLPRLVPLGPTYALTAPDLPEGPLSPGLVWGANMAIRDRVFQAGHRFNEQFGPRPGQYRMGSETEFTTRIAKAGHLACHVPASVVQHMIRSGQMDVSWIISRAYRAGRGMFWRENDPALILDHDMLPSQGPYFLGLPRWMYRKAVEDLVRVFAAKLKGDFDGWFTAQWDLSFRRGYLAEGLSLEGRALRSVRGATA